MPPININDPRNILSTAMPMIVLSNQTNSWIGEIIDFRTDLKGVHPYDHAMLTIDPGKFVCQGLSYTEIPMSQYLIKGGQLAFVQLVNANNTFISAFRASVLKRLAGPWYSKIYDFLGILGQAIGATWIHTPGLDYCSVDVIRHLKDAAPYLPAFDYRLIMAIPNETNPEALWDIIIKNPDVFFQYGTWDSTIGVTV